MKKRSIGISEGKVAFLGVKVKRKGLHGKVYTLNSIARARYAKLMYYIVGFSYTLCYHTIVYTRGIYDGMGCACMGKHDNN